MAEELSALQKERNKLLQLQLLSFLRADEDEDVSVLFDLLLNLSRCLQPAALLFLTGLPPMPPQPARGLRWS